MVPTEPMDHLEPRPKAFVLEQQFLENNRILPSAEQSCLRQVARPV